MFDGFEHDPLRVILIGGPSHAGKSTLAQAVGAKLGWRCVSTDTLARHPGRPWGHVKDHVAEHYLSLSPDELIADVLRHYRSMWPGIRSMISTPTDPLILEGSALWPESVAELQLHTIGAIWLTASDGFLRKRMYESSRHHDSTARGKVMIEKFGARNELYNRQMMQALHRLGLPWLDVEQPSAVEELQNDPLRVVKPLAPRP